MIASNRVDLQPAFVLHSKPYRDTSLIIDLLTIQHGKIRVVARGARSAKSRLSGVLSPFVPLLVSYRCKNELGNLYKAETQNLIGYMFNGKALLSGFYLNELLIKLLDYHEPCNKIYHSYQNTLSALAISKQIEVELRIFEKNLLAALGYGLNLKYTFDHHLVLPDKKYFFEFGHGLKETTSQHPTNYLGKNLLALDSGNLRTPDELKEAKRLLRTALATLLGNKTINSRKLFSYGATHL